MRGDLAEGGVGLEIEDDDCAVSAAVGDEPATYFRDDGYTVSVLLTGNVAEGLAGIRVDDHGVGASGDEEPMGCRVDGEVVP